jgi:hypothetical protein
VFISRPDRSQMSRNMWPIKETKYICVVYWLNYCIRLRHDEAKSLGCCLCDLAWMSRPDQLCIEDPPPRYRVVSNHWLRCPPVLTLAFKRVLLPSESGTVFHTALAVRLSRKQSSRLSSCLQVADEQLWMVSFCREPIRRTADQWIWTSAVRVLWREFETPVNGSTVVYLWFSPCKRKGKVFPLQAEAGPWGSLLIQKVKASGFCRLSAVWRW